MADASQLYFIRLQLSQQQQALNASLKLIHELQIKVNATAHTAADANVQSVLILSTIIFCISALTYLTIGWSLSFGCPSNPFIGFGQFLFIGVKPQQYAFWFLHFLYASNASTIVSGALVERCQVSAYIIYCAVMTGLIYPPIAHWVWDDVGWLRNGPGGVKFQDFAGSGPVHLVGGICGCMGSYVLGPRIGRFATKANKKAPDLKGHSVPFAMLGGFLLMFGFFAFNGSSAVELGAEVVALCMINTLLSGTTGALVSMVVNRLWQTRRWTLTITVNATLAAMVAICAGCDQMHPWAACLTGALAALTNLAVSHIVKKLEIDDPLDVTAVHAGGGLVGLITAPIIGNNGIIFRLHDSLAYWSLMWNILGTAVIVLWCAVFSFPVFILLKKYNLFRVSVDVETKGLDVYVHGEPAYPLVAYGHGWTDNTFSDEDMAVLNELPFTANPRNNAQPKELHYAPTQTPMMESATVDSRMHMESDHEIESDDDEQIPSRLTSQLDIREPRYRHLLPKFGDRAEDEIEPKWIKFTTEAGESLDTWLEKKGSFSVAATSSSNLTVRELQPRKGSLAMGRIDEYKAVN